MIGACSNTGRVRQRRQRAEAAAQTQTATAAKQEEVALSLPRPEWKPDPAMAALAAKVGASAVEIDVPCLEGTDSDCERRALDRVFIELDALLDQPLSQVRIVQLGDSHIAADYITGTIRERLQAIFGDAGRGFTHADQRDGYGGRRLGARAGWRRFRIVDPGQAGQRFGFSGIVLESYLSNAYVDYELADDDRITLYFDTGPKAGELRLSLGDELLGRADAKDDRVRTELKTIAIPKRTGNGPDKRIVRLTADANTRLYGMSFTRSKAGIIYDSNGPVGADAAVYLSLEAASFAEHLKLVSPALIVIMLGGNDALRVRQGKTNMAAIKKEFAALVERIQQSSPESDCMLWGPMDAGERKNGKIVSKTYVAEVRDVIREVAREQGCAFWDLYAAMGGEGSIARWYKENIINQDLVHPRAKAGQLIGELFAEAFVRAYSEE